MPILDLKNVAKTYHTRFNANAVTALTDISLSVEAGEYVAIMGESGSGKVLYSISSPPWTNLLLVALILTVPN